MSVVAVVLVVLVVWCSTVGLVIRPARQQRECDRLNAELDQQYEALRWLTPEDLERLHMIGWQEPLPIRWELR